MNLSFLVFLAVCLFALVFALDRSGIFRWIDSRLNVRRDQVMPIDLSGIQSDIDKLKLAMKFKEFKGGKP